MKTILSEYVDRNVHDAGNKARSDAIEIAQGLGYVHIPLFRSGAPKAQVLCQLVAGTIRAAACTGRGEDLLIQYPYYPQMVNRILCKVLAWGRRVKGYRMTVLVHDLPGLRDGGDRARLKEEARALSVCDRIICHNGRMKDLLEELAPGKNYKVLGPFDYLYQGQAVPPAKAQPPQVIIAGNLSPLKAGYVYQLQELKEVQFQLYGIGYQPIKAENVHYQGQFAPEQLIRHLQGSYGLVWDGSSIHTCGGTYGAYLRYNHPHKFSLYLAAGLPVIVWKQSALAEYVMEQGVGIAVEDLEELRAVLAAVDDAGYQVMCRNVLRIRQQIVSGAHLRAALLDG